MSIREKLELQKEIDARNEERAKEFTQQKVADIHRSIEIYAGSIIESVGVLADYHGANRGMLLDLLISTLQAMEQTRQQEG